MSHWKVDTADWTKITRDMAAFYAGQAEARLKDTTALSERITARGFSLLTIIIPIISITLAYLFQQVAATPQANGWLTALAFFCLAAALVCLVLLVRIIFPRMTMYNGREPKDIMIPEMLDNDLPEDQKYMAIAISQIQDTQHKITFNNVANKQRIGYLKTAILVISATFTVAMSFLIVQFF